jgi:hypothetical protein
LTQGEAAEVLGVSVRTVQRRLNRSLLLLAMQLQRAAELARGADLRLSPPMANGSTGDAGPTAKVRFKTDHRLPLPGTILARPYKGEDLHVKVLPGGFEFEGEVYQSLSAVAKKITGSHCNG